MDGFIIEEELKKLPNSPGVYLMHKADGEIIYVGKAKNLNKRVHQYFNKSYKKTNKIQQMVSNIDYFEYIVVDNELESLILESNYIKELRPRYNTLLKDDKNYPYIKLTIDEEYPRVFFVHRKQKDKAMYFGPYKSGLAVRETLDFIKDNFKLRTCKMKIDDSKINSFEDMDVPTVNGKRNKECLYYHIDMCLAPCINKNIKSEYDKNVKDIIDFLKGDTKNIINELTNQMNTYSEKQEYEKAALLRDKIYSIQEIDEKQKISQNNANDEDVIGLYKESNLCMIQIFEVRDGNIIDRSLHLMNIDENDTDKDIMESFIKQYYNEAYFLPKEIWLPCDIDDRELLEEWLYNQSNKKIKIIIPKKGQNNRLVHLASENAKIQWKQRAKNYEKDKKDIDIAYDVLKKMTGLDSIDRLESYDISNTAGNINVASMVVFMNYNFKKNEYRKFRIKTIEGPDDYGSMREVITRRLERYLKDDEKFDTLPSIFLIDGGQGQVNVVKEVLSQYNLDIAVMGMVKDDNHRTRGLLYDEVELDLNNHKELFRLITKIQDETHRFAIEYHRSLRSKEQIHSILDDIEGIGEKRKINLIKHFGDIESIKNATVDEIKKVPLFNEKAALSVVEFFKDK